MMMSALDDVVIGEILISSPLPGDLGGGLDEQLAALRVRWEALGRSYEQLETDRAGLAESADPIEEVLNYRRRQIAVWREHADAAREVISVALAVQREIRDRRVATDDELVISENEARRDHYAKTLIEATGHDLASYPEVATLQNQLAFLRSIESRWSSVPRAAKLEAETATRQVRELVVEFLGEKAETDGNGGDEW